MRQYRMALVVVVVCVLCAFVIGWKADAQQGRLDPAETGGVGIPGRGEPDDRAAECPRVRKDGSLPWSTSYGKDYYYILKRQK